MRSNNKINGTLLATEGNASLSWVVKNPIFQKLKYKTFIQKTEIVYPICVIAKELESATLSLVFEDEFRKEFA